MKTQSVEEFAAEMEALANSFGQDQTEALEACKPVILAGVEENFAGAHTSSGSSWPPRKDKLSHPLLNKTGALKGAATGSGAGHVERIENGNELLLGVDKGVKAGGIPGAGVHQFGFRDVPARPYLGISEKVADECAQIVADEGLKKLA